MVRVDDDLDGKSIDEVCHIGKTQVGMIYDENGNPIFPYSETIVRKGWNLLFFGEFLHE